MLPVEKMVVFHSLPMGISTDKKTATPFFIGREYIPADRVGRPPQFDRPCRGG